MVGWVGGAQLGEHADLVGCVVVDYWFVELCYYCVGAVYVFGVEREHVGGCEWVDGVVVGYEYFDVDCFERGGYVL